MNNHKHTFLVSGYAEADKPGIHTLTFDHADATLDVKSIFSGIANPSFMVVHPHGQRVYAVSETGEGTVWALQYDASTASLTPLNHQSSGGHSPCHLTVDSTGQWLLVANYVSGSVGVLPIGEDGKIGEQTHLVQHSGKGANAERQDAPHAHSTIFSPDERFLIAADLGADSLFIYRFDRKAGQLIRHGQIRTTPGAGPRHMVFHPNGQWLYVANELDNTVTAYQYDSHNGELTSRQTLPTLPPKAPATTTADIHLTETGSHLYISNRGHDSLAIYEIATNGHLTLAAIQPCGGQGPRNFALAPKAKFVVVANEKSDNLVLFSVNPQTGVSDNPIAQTALPSPTCVLFL